MMNDDTCVVEELTVWFKQRLIGGDVQFGDEPMSYEANTQYDVQFYHLQKEAAAYWQNQYGFAPTPGQLMQGFFGAEYERFRQAKLDRMHWRDKLRRGIANARRDISHWIKRGLVA